LSLEETHRLPDDRVKFSADSVNSADSF
jgi:hypothetical protein